MGGFAYVKNYGLRFFISNDIWNIKTNLVNNIQLSQMNSSSVQKQLKAAGIDTNSKKYKAALSEQIPNDRGMKIIGGNEMSIAGINGYNYSNYYTGTKRNTAKANGMNSGLLSNVSSTSSNITLHMSGTEDSGNALTAVGFPDGSSASVYKSDAYDSANPEYRVRYWDKEGNYTDTNVQINDVDPRNASYLEMLAYTTYSDVEGFTKNAFGDFMNAAGGVNGNITYDSDSINEKKDYMSMIKEFMQLQYDSNNLSGYLSYKELYDYINDRTER